MLTDEPATDPVLDALGDPTRRTILELLRGGGRSVQELADELPVSRPAVSQHLRVLSAAQLVGHERHGARRVYRLDVAGLAAVRTYLDLFWTAALAELKAIAETDEEGSIP